MDTVYKSMNKAKYRTGKSGCELLKWPACEIFPRLRRRIFSFMLPDLKIKTAAGFTKIIHLLVVLMKSRCVA
jgi:hypothetical protein